MRRRTSRAPNIIAVCAPNAFKGTLSARAAAAAMARGVRDTGADAIEVLDHEGAFDVYLAAIRSRSAPIKSVIVASPCRWLSRLELYDSCDAANSATEASYFFFADTLVADITQADAANALDAIKRPSERAHAYTALKTFFNWCLARQLCAANPLSTQDDVAAALVDQYGIPTIGYGRAFFLGLYNRSGLGTGIVPMLLPQESPL